MCVVAKGKIKERPTWDRCEDINIYIKQTYKKVGKSMETVKRSVGARPWGGRDINRKHTENF